MPTVQYSYAQWEAMPQLQQQQGLLCLSRDAGKAGIAEWIASKPLSEGALVVYDGRDVNAARVFVPRHDAFAPVR